MSRIVLTGYKSYKGLKGKKTTRPSNSSNIFTLIHLCALCFPKCFSRAKCSISTPKRGKMQYFCKKVCKKFGVLKILSTFAPANKTVRDVAQSG